MMRDEDDHMNDMGDEGKVIKLSLDVACVALVLLVLWFAFTLGIERGKYAVLFLGISFVISALRVLIDGRFLGIKGGWLTAGGLLFIGIFIAATAYLYFQYIDMLTDRAGAYTGVDVLVGAGIVAALFLLIWKEGGLALFALILLFLLYFHSGNHFPGILEHSGFSVRRIIEESILGFEGVYGIVLLTVSTWVAIFLIYAGIIRGFGSLDTIVKACTIIFSRRRSFIPQIPVAASLIFGSFSGSATANVAGTGSFTISIMKRFRIPSLQAGAIESVASSGGQIMPPLMGATAFLIASFLGVSYLHIVVVGFLPAFLFYLALAFSVYWRTAEHVSLDSIAFMEEDTWSKEDWIKLLPLVLSVAVLFARLTLLVPMMRACIEGVFVFVIAQLLYELIANLKKKSVVKIFADFGVCLFNGVKGCAPSAASIGLIGAAMGFIVRVLTVTGLGPKISEQLVDLSHGILPLLLFFILILCILFGMAVSTLAVYVLTTFVAAPALKEMGIPLMATHFMIFYLGNMSFITPPVAPAPDSCPPRGWRRGWDCPYSYWASISFTALSCSYGVGRHQWRPLSCLSAFAA
jgi:TRAP transporter 4TM/12TM fusion protein